MDPLQKRGLRLECRASDLIMTYLVTGGAGFIGSNTVRVLLRDGQRVRVLDNLATGRAGNLDDVRDEIEWIEGDLRDPDALKRALDGVGYVFHLAALPSVARSVEDPLAASDINIRGTLELLVAARDAGVDRFVFASSSSVYGDTPLLPKQEDMTPNPLSPYAVQKLAGEHYCRIFSNLYGLKAFALRFFNVFGPRQDPKSDYAAVIPAFVDAARRGASPTIHGDGGQTRDFTYVDDVAAGMMSCCTAPDTAAGQVYNLAWGRRTSIRELADKILDLAGRSDLEPEFGPLRAGDVRDSQADATRARELLGWEPRISFEEGLRQTVEWYIQNGS